MHWYWLVGTGYVILVIVVCLRILYDISSTAKTFAYLLGTILLPVIGMVIYFAVGANYRKNKLYSKKIINDNKLRAEMRNKIVHESEKTWETGEKEVKSHKKLARLLLNDNSPLTGDNEVTLLLDGEQKFPEVIKALKEAKHHIHMQYYIFENDGIGNQIKDILIQKAAEGVNVRFIYDDFGSWLQAGLRPIPFIRSFLLRFQTVQIIVTTVK
jgi:cardiolipin synthase